MKLMFIQEMPIALGNLENLSARRRTTVFVASR